MRSCLIVFFTFLCCATAGQAADDAEQELQNRLRAHIEFLADDRLRGRQPGTDGYDIAANYVASQFLQMGLLPAGTADSYFQQVPLRQALLEPESAEMSFSYKGRVTRLVFAEHFFVAPSLSNTESSVEAEMVFVGYGIDAPELDYNDYENIDVTGKVVVILAGQPHDFPSEEGAHFASRTEMRKAAVRHGAVGTLMIHTPRAGRRYDWDMLNSLVGKPSMGWIGVDGLVQGDFEQLKAGAMVSHTAAEVLFEDAVFELDMLLGKDEDAKTLPAFGLKGKIRMSKRSSHTTIHSPNVVAVLPGSDPLLKDEYVLYTAHLDHIGERVSDDGKGDGQNDVKRGHKDLINNGALDNASGVSVMLETARLLSKGQRPRRSILFVAVTAEEKGLVGSEYFAMNAPVPITSIVSEVNLDMPLLLYDFADVIAFGAEHSSLGNTIELAASSYGITLTPDPFPEQNVFVRSDHYRFVQQGVPSVYLATGMKARGGDINIPMLYQAFQKQHYHRPSDDVNLPIHYGAAARFTRINAKIGEIVANDPQRPTWHEGDFFGRTFAK